MKRLLLLLFAVTLLAQQPSAIPERKQPEVQDLRDQLTDCSISSRNAEQYILTLKATIDKLAKENAALKAQASPAEKSK